MSGELIFWIFVAVVVVVFICFLAVLPGKIARDRGHPSADAIQVCAMFGVLIPLLWIVAFIWAYTGPANPRRSHASARFVSRTYVSPATSLNYRAQDIDEEVDEAFSAVSGRFKITGVDRESKLDTTWYTDAQSAENAKVKAELEGIIVTKVEPA